MPSDPTVITIGQRIKEAIGDQSLIRVAADIEVHPDTLIRYINGTSVRGPSYKDMVAISRVTGKPLEFFTDATEAVA